MIGLLLMMILLLLSSPLTWRGRISSSVNCTSVVNFLRTALIPPVDLYQNEMKSCMGLDSDKLIVSVEEVDPAAADMHLDLDKVFPDDVNRTAPGVVLVRLQYS